MDERICRRLSETKRDYFGVDGKPRRKKGDVVGWQKTYRDGKLVENFRYGFDPALGYTKERLTFDQNDRIKLHELLNDEGQLALSRKSNVAGWTYEYDTDGNRTGYQVFVYTGSRSETRRGSNDGRRCTRMAQSPTIYSGYEGNGYASIKSTYDAKGRGGQQRSISTTRRIW